MSRLLDKAVVEIDGVDAGLSKTLEDASHRIDGFSKTVGQATGGLGGIDAALSKVSGRLGGVGSALTTVSGAAGVVAAAVAGVAVQATQMALSFDREMRSVRTVTDQTKISVEALSDGVLEIFQSLPVDSTAELTRALYDIESAGVQGADALKVLELSAKAAVAGATDVGTAAKAITASMAAYAQMGLTAEEATDKLTQAANSGRLSFGELAGQIGQVVPLAAAYHISLDEIGASLAVLTTNGMEASTAATSLRSAIANAVSPTAEFTKQFPQLAEAFTVTRLERDGFVKFLVDLNRESRGSKAALGAFFSDIQGRQAVFSLLADGGQALNTQLTAMQHSAGATAKGLADVEQSASAAYDQFKNRLSTLMLHLGDTILPSVNARLRETNDLLKALGEHDTQKLGEIFKSLDPRAVPFLPSALSLGILGTGAAIGRFGPQPVGTTQNAASVTPSPAALARAGAAAAARAEAQRLEAEATARVARVQKTLDDTTDLSVARLAALRAALVDVANGTTAAATQAKGLIEGLDKRLREAVKQAATTAATARRQIESFNQTVLGELAQGTDTLVDDLEASLRQLRTQAHEVAEATKGKGAGVSVEQTQLQALIDLRLREIAATKLQEAQERALANARASAGADEADALRDAQRIIAEIGQQADLQVFGQGFVTDDDLADLQQVEQLLQSIAKDAQKLELLSPDQQAALKAVLEQIQRIRAATSQPAPTGPATTEAERLTTHLRENVRLIESAVDGALQLAHAFGLSADAADRLRSVGSIAANIPLLLREIHNVRSGAADEKGNPISSVTSILGAALPIVGGIASLAAGAAALFGKHEDPAAIARQQEIARIETALTAALRELNTTVGGIDLTASLSGRSAAVGVAGRGLEGVFGENNPAGLTEAALKSAGISFAEFRAQAKRLGIELPETVQEITAAMLHGVIDAANSVSVRFDDLARSWEVLGTSATDQMGELLDFLETIPGDVGRIATRVRSDFDLTNQTGRDAAIAFIRDQFRQGLIPPELATKIINGINAEGDEFAKAASEAAAKIAKAFQDIADALNTIDLTRQIDGGAADASVIKQQVAAYAKGLPEAFRDGFVHAIDGLDLDTAEGRAAAKKKLQAYYHDVLLADGVLDDSEKEIAQGIVSIIGEIDDLGTSILEEAEKLRVAANQKILDTASLISTALHEDAPHTLKRNVGAEGQLSPEFARAAAGLDLTSADGIAAFTERIDALLLRIADGDKTLDLGSLTWEEFTSAALGMENAATSAAAAFDNLAGKLDKAGKEAKRRGEDPTAAQADVFKAKPETAALIGTADLTTPAGRAAALARAQESYRKVANAVVGEFIDWLQGFGDAATAAGTAAFDSSARAAGGGASTVTADVERITSTEAGRLGDLAAAQTALLRESLVVQQGIAATLAQMAAAAAGSIVPPYTPQIAGGGRGAPVVVAGGIGDINLGGISIELSGEVLTGAPDAAGLIDALGRLSAAELERRLGPVLQEALRRVLVKQLPTSHRFS